MEKQGLKIFSVPVFQVYAEEIKSIWEMSSRNEPIKFSPGLQAEVKRALEIMRAHDAQRYQSSK